MRGTITNRKTKDGQIRYRARIKIDREGLGKFTESRTFSKKSLASEWLRQRTAEIERDPNILLAVVKKEVMTLAEAISRYLDDVGSSFAKSKLQATRFIGQWPIARKRLDELTRTDYVEHINLRRNGYPPLDANPIAPSTAGQDLYYIRAVLIHAEMTWGDVVKVDELDAARRGLSKSRVISKSAVRHRLPTAEELQQLTNYFYQRYQRKNSTYPMHLIIWAAIYLCRRDAELCRIKISDTDIARRTMIVRDVKSPDGSAGNHKKARIPELAVSVINDLLKAREKLDCDDDRLIPVDAKSVSTYFARACNVLAINDLRLHDLRHEGATRLAEDGLTIPQIQQVTLHESWGSLQLYVNVEPRGERLNYEDAMQVAKAD